MPDHEEPINLEQVEVARLRNLDEQIEERLREEPHPSDRREVLDPALLRALHTYYLPRARRFQRGLDRVWGHLEQQGVASVHQHPHRQYRPTNRTNHHQERQDLTLRIFHTSPRWSARVMNLIAVALLIVLVGGLTLGLILVHHAGTGTAGGPTNQATEAVTSVPTPTATPLVLTCTAPAAPTIPPGSYAPIDASGKVVYPDRLTLNADGSSSRSGTRGCYALAQNQFTLTETTSSPRLMSDCRTAVATGVYIWTYADKILSFTLVNDHCDVRVQELIPFRWEIIPASS
jgi:hypothetical protein